MPQSGQPIRVVVVDDHQIVREGLIALLEALDGIAVVGSAADGLDAIRTLTSVDADVVVMDIQMPGLNGIEATRRIVTDHPDVSVVMLTMNEDDETVMSAIRAGARGYLLKGSNASDVLRAVQTAAGGGLVLGPELATRVAAYLSGGSPREREQLFPDLTDRERSVLELLASGRSNDEIARLTHLSGKSVRNVVSSIYAKLGAKDRAAAIIMAREAGLNRDHG